jgi:hypothetical protein
VPELGKIEDDVPHILATGLRIGNTKKKFIVKCLINSGGTDPMINHMCIPLTMKLKVCNSAKFLMTQGEFTSAHTVEL